MYRIKVEQTYRTMTQITCTIMFSIRILKRTRRGHLCSTITSKNERTKKRKKVNCQNISIEREINLGRGCQALLHSMKEEGAIKIRRTRVSGRQDGSADRRSREKILPMTLQGFTTQKVTLGPTDREPNQLPQKPWDA